MKKVTVLWLSWLIFLLGNIPFGACSPTHKRPVEIVVFSGNVVGVKDGDTVVVMHNGKGETIRLYGIDAPEKKQDFGAKAKLFMSELVFNKIVLVKSHGIERWGRTIGEIFLEDGRSVNQEIVKAGFAWWYEQYAPHDEELKRLQNEAQVSKLGLWSMTNPVPPWNFRNLKKKPKNS